MTNVTDESPEPEQDTETTESTELPEWWIELGQYMLIEAEEIDPDSWDSVAILYKDTADLLIYYPDLEWSTVGTVVEVYEEAREKARHDRDWTRKAVYLGTVIRDSIGGAESVF